jgi:hypothetical protein
VFLDCDQIELGQQKTFTLAIITTGPQYGGLLLRVNETGVAERVGLAFLHRDHLVPRERATFGPLVPIPMQAKWVRIH